MAGGSKRWAPGRWVHIGEELNWVTDGSSSSTPETSQSPKDGEKMRDSGTIPTTESGADSYTTAQQIAKTAAILVSEDRNATHGDKLENHRNIAILWQSYIACKALQTDEEEFELNALDVANMMELLKVARRLSGCHNIDDYIDGAGYAAVAGEIAERLQRKD